MITALLMTLLLSGPPSFAAVQGHEVPYSSGNDQMEGYAASDSAAHGRHPAILIVHDWMGLGPFQREKADKLAREGYVAFAADIYGKGVHPQSPQEAGELAKKYKSDRALLRAHVRAAYDALVARTDVDPKRVVVMGYCFGGTTALELARSGARLAGTVSFHGGLSTPTPDDARNIHGPVLALHGADDPNVPPAEVAAFKKEMKDAHVPLTFIAYPGAVHAFTNPAAGNDNSKGAAYNAKADRQSWIAFERFLHKILGPAN